MTIHLPGNFVLSGQPFRGCVFLRVVYAGCLTLRTVQKQAIHIIIIIIIIINNNNNKHDNVSDISILKSAWLESRVIELEALSLRLFERSLWFDHRWRVEGDECSVLNQKVCQRVSTCQSIFVYETISSTKFEPTLHPGGVCIPTHSGYFSICFWLLLWLLGASKIEISKVNSQLPKFVWKNSGTVSKKVRFQDVRSHETWPQIPQIFWTWKRQKYNLKDKAAQGRKRHRPKNRQRCAEPSESCEARSLLSTACVEEWWPWKVKWRRSSFSLAILLFCISIIYIIVLLFDIDTEDMCKIINMCISTSFL